MRTVPAEHQRESQNPHGSFQLHHSMANDDSLRSWRPACDIYIELQQNLVNLFYKL